VEIATRLQEAAITMFTFPAEEITLSESGWSYTAVLEELKENLSQEITKRKAEEMKKALEEFKKSLQISLIEPVSIALGEGKENMWSEIQKNVVRSVTLADTFVNKFQRGNAPSFLLFFCFFPMAGRPF